MKLLLDFFPIILFFIAYKLSDIYVATGVAIVVSTLQVIGFWIKFRRFEMMQLATLIIILVLGGATILLHDAWFIKWKPSVVYWIFAVAFAGSQYIGKKNLIRRLMDSKITLPDPIWRTINWAWTGFFAILGFVNIYVIYNFSTNAWVNFKLFGALGLTIAFAFATSFYMMRHAKTDSEQKNESPSLKENHEQST